MTRNQKIYFVQKFNLSEDQLFSLDMQLHVMALQRGVFVFELAALLIDMVEKR